MPVDWKPSVSLENGIKFVKVFPKENGWSAYKWRQQINSNGRSDPRERDNSGGLKQHENLLSAFYVEIENWSLNSVPAFECKWGWGWPCFDTNLFPFLMEIMLKKNTSLHKENMIYIRKQEGLYQNKVKSSLQCRCILGGRNIVRVVAAIFDFITVEDWGE